MPPGHQGHRFLSKKLRSRGLAIYGEMEKANLFKKANPNYQEDKRKDQERGQNQSHQGKLVELVARDRLHKGGSGSAEEGPTKAQSRLSSEGGTKGRPKGMPNSQPPGTKQIDQVWKDYKVQKLRTPRQSPHYRIRSDERRQLSFTRGSRYEDKADWAREEDQAELAALALGADIKAIEKRTCAREANKPRETSTKGQFQICISVGNCKVPEALEL